MGFSQGITPRCQPFIQVAPLVPEERSWLSILNFVLSTVLGIALSGVLLWPTA